MRTALFVLLASAATAYTQPKLNIPGELKPSGQYVDFLPDTDAKGISYIGLDGVDPFPGNRLSDPRLFILDTRGLAAGTYRFVAVGSLADKHTRAYFVVRIGDAPKPPIPVPVPVPVVSALAKVSREGLAMVADKTSAKALADANRALASKIAAGAHGEPPVAAAVLAEWRKVNNEAATAATWKPWADLVSPALQRQYTSGGLSSKAQWVEAFNEIAKGLEPNG